MELTEEQKKRLRDLAERKEKQQKQAAKDQSGWGKRIADAASETAEDVFVAADQATNAATFGLAGQAYRHAGALGEYLRSDDESMGYQDFLKQVDAERAARRDANPISSMVGTVGGSIVGGKGLDKLAARVGGGVLGRLGMAAGAGAAQNVGIDMGNAELDTLADVGTSASLGAVGGGVGQAIGEAIMPAYRGIAGRLSPEGITKTAQREVGQSLFDAKAGQGSLRAALYGDAPMDEAAILADIAKRQDFMRQTGRAFGETDPRILKVTEGLTANPATTGLTGSLGDIAQRRVSEVDDNIMGTLMDHLTDSNRAVTGADAALDAAGRKALAKDAFKGIFDTPEAATVPVMSKAQFVRQANFVTDDAGRPIFDLDNATSTTKRTLKRFVDEVEDIGAGRLKRGISLKGMQNVKGEVDGLIRNSMRSADTGPERLAVSDLVALKKYIQSTMQGIDEGYAAASAQFGDAAAYDDLTELGRQYMSGSLTGAKAKELSEYVNSLAPGERGAMQDGALEWLKNKLASQPNYLKTLSSNAGEQQKLATVFGDAIASNGSTLDDVTKMVGESFDARKSYETIAQNVKNAPKNASGPIVGNEGAFADAATIMTKGGAGHFSSSSIMNAARRLMTAHPERTQQVMVDLMRQETPEGVQTLIDEIMRLRNTANASLGWGRGTAGLASAISSIMD